MDFNKDLCEQKHKDIDDKLKLHEGHISTLYDRTSSMQAEQAKQGEKLDNVCKSLDNLAKSNWALFSGVMLALLGFFFWYIQNIK